MRVTVEVEENIVERLIRNIMEGYPEASSPSLRCLPHDDGTWGYNSCVYFFDEVEEDSLCPDAKCGTVYSKRIGRSVYQLTYDDLRRGFEVFINLKIAGKLAGVPLDLSYLNRPDKWEHWEGSWDADCLDCLVQCAIYGEVIYG